MLDQKVTKPGTLVFKDGTAYVDGWDLSEPGMCREHAIMACLYVAAWLQRAAIDDIAVAGGSDEFRVVADLPADAPPEWYCDSTRAFLGHASRSARCTQCCQPFAAHKMPEEDGTFDPIDLQCPKRAREDHR